MISIRRLARSRAAVAIHGRQGQAQLRQQDGADRYPTAAHRRGHERDPLGGSQGREHEPLARDPRHAQPEDGRGGRARQQDGADDLGRDDAAGRLQDGVTGAPSGRRHVVAARPGRAIDEE